MKQIFILEKEELTALRNGEPLMIQLGDQKITLQADVVRKQLKPAPILFRKDMDRRTRAYKMANGGKTISDRVIDFVQSSGPMSAVEIAKHLGASRSAVSSALGRFQGIAVRRTGKNRRAVWRAK
jgi:CRP-like cAMP-binding protein